MKNATEQTNLEKIQCFQEIVNEIQEASKRPVCRLHLSHETFCITDSHLGGIPYLPHNETYPTGNDGQSLWLCAQINFAQMPPMEGFPSKGILQFFLSDFDYDGGFGLYSEQDGTIQGPWRTFYYPSVDETVTEEECRTKMPEQWEDAADLWRTPNRPLKMTFLPVEQEVVNHENYLFDALFAAALTKRLPDADPETYMPYAIDSKTPEERNALDKIYHQIRIGGCKIGGYPRYYQDDPRLYSESCGKPLEKWDILLFQLDDDNFTFPAGDIDNMDISLNGGTLNFLIRPEDLEKCDFSQVLPEWACT